MALLAYTTRSHPKAPYRTLLQKRKYPTHMAPFNV